jgi:formate dehydrogenase iron-sulfur subunit
VFCSVMLYHATKKKLWSLSRTGFRFFATTLLLGMASSLASASLGSEQELFAIRPAARLLSLTLAAAGAAKLVWELGILAHLRDKQLTELKRTALILTGELRPFFLYRLALGVAFGILCPLLTARAWNAAAILHRPSVVAGGIVGLLGLCLAELLERVLFFRAVNAPRMPGHWGGS